MNREGVIKFQFEHTTGAACEKTDIAELAKWRNELRARGLLGQNPSRYGGYGYGNISKKLNDETFLITASQTGHLQELSPAEFVRITAFDPARNWVRSIGMNKPSSESMTHLAVYGANREVGCIFHVHCPEIWAAREKLNLPVTSAKIEYGTPEMFYAVLGLLGDTKNYQKGILAMGGHEDGTIVWGATADEAGNTLLSYLS